MQYRVIRNFEYPDPESLAALKQEHGVTVLTPEMTTTVELCQPRVGDICGELPDERIAVLVGLGYLEPVTGDGDGWPEGLSLGAVKALDESEYSPADIASTSDEDLLAIKGVAEASLDLLRESFGPESGTDND